MKVAIYCRLSEEDRFKIRQGDDSESIQNQKSILIDYAVERGWEIFDIYSDDDYTGADRNRPEWNRLLRDAEARNFDIVLCKTQSRFTREIELVEKYIHTLFPIWNIRFVSIVDHADTEVKGNKKARQINGLINEWYLEDLSENIKTVFTNKRKNGFHIGAFALYGYMKDPYRKGHLIIDEEAAQVVREVFRLFDSGYGKSNIARILNNKGIPNPTEYKRRKGLRYQQPDSQVSTLWKYYTIQSMLINEIYIGNMVQGRYESVSYKTKKNKPRPKEKWFIVPNTHEPIIDRQLWDRVQEKIKQRAKPFTNTGKIGVFARKTKCMYCGYTLHTCKHHNERYLQCPTRYIHKDSCRGSMVSYPVLERFVLSEIHNLSKKYLDINEIKENVDFNQEIDQRIQSLKTQIDTYNHKIYLATKGVKDLYLDKTKGIITEDEFIELSKGFHKDKEEFQAIIEDLEDDIQTLQKKLEKSTDCKELIKQYTNAEKLSREMVETLIDYIEVGARIEGTRNRPIKIHWNF